MCLKDSYITGQATTTVVVEPPLATMGLVEKGINSFTVKENQAKQ